MFWHHPDKSLAKLRHLLRAGGRIAVAHRPRGPGVTDATAMAAGTETETRLRQAGFSDVRMETLALKPAVVCAIGINQSEGHMRTELTPAHRVGTARARHRRA